MTYDNLIIDGNNFLFRSFYSKKPPRIVKGLDTAPINQCLYMLKAVAERYTPKNIYFTWDKRLNDNAVNFRREIVGEYKENRIDTEEKLNVLSYIGIIVDFCDALGIKTIFPYDLEGDDVMYYLSMTLEGKSLVISSDRDLLQMVTENVHQFIPTKNIIVDLNNFETFAKVKPEAFILYKSIMGDKSDNISGLYKFGEVRAKALAEKILAEGGLEKSLLSEDSKKIIQDNIRIIDLKLSHLERPDEFKRYKEQFDATRNNRFDVEFLRTLFHKYELGHYARDIGSWRRLFLVEETSNMEWWKDPLAYITA